MKPIEPLQEAIWGYGRKENSPFPYPARCLFEFAESGGHVGGAFDSDGQLVGFSAAWIGRDRPSRQLYLHSQLVGILEGFRNAGVGYTLKQMQREFAVSEHIPTIKWTFDPLQFRNAHLNLHKLRARATSFVSNYFGGLGGLQNSSLPTDRLWITWTLDESAHTEPIDNVGDLASIMSVERSSVEPQCLLDMTLDERVLALHLPKELSQLRRDKPILVAKWQSQLATALSAYMAKYEITDAVSSSLDFCYILRRR